MGVRGGATAARDLVGVMTDNAAAGGSAGVPCRFCGRRPDPSQYRIAGPRGPICVSCIETGLRLTNSRKPEFDDSSLRRMDSHSETACEFCRHSVRLNFLGFRRPLLRVTSTSSDAVICSGCLEWAGNLLNSALR